MRKSTEKLTISQAENPILSRPATSGSLRPRSSINRKENRIHSVIEDQNLINPQKKINLRYRAINQDSEKIAERPKSGISNQSKNFPKATNFDNEKNGERPKSSVSGTIKKQGKTEYVTFEDPDKNSEEEIKDENENNENEAAEGDLHGDNEIDKKSNLTTSTQQKYIEELETLLRFEKLKRIKLEESLLKLQKSNSFKQ